MTAIDIGALTLTKGAHDSREDGVCLLEAVAWWAGKEHTDCPACVSPVLAAFGRSWNDGLDDGARQELRRFIPLLPGTAEDGLDVARGLLALDWLTRVCLPAFLDAAGLTGHAADLRRLAPVTTSEDARTAQPRIDAAGAAARDAAWDAAWAAAWDAARDAVRDAVWDAVRAAAWDAARDAADSDEDQYQAAYAAAKPLIEEKFAPVTTGLQQSALLMLERLIEVERRSSA